METLWWTLTALLMLGGLAGTVVPLLPGTILIFSGAVLNALTLHSVGWPTLLALLAFLLLAQAVEFLSGAAGAKVFGASRWGALGGLIGAVVGIFFGLPGLLLGPLLGAVAGELLSGKGALPAGVAGWGTFLGTTLGLVVKIVIGTAMIATFCLAAFVW